MAQNITLLGASYSDVPAVELPKTGGGTAAFFDVSGTTATASDVASGKVFVDSSGIITTGSGGSATLVPYAIRPDATLVKTYTYDKYIVGDEKATLPGYTTTATVLKASANLSETITVDLANYRYFVVEKFLSIPTYSVSTKGKGRVEYNFCCYIYESARLAANEIGTFIDPSKLITSATTIWSANSLYRILYWTSNSAISLYASNGYGVYQTPSSPSISSSTMTVKSPALSTRGSTTYFTSTYMGAMTDVRYQYVIDVYRSPLNNLNLDGWEQDQMLQHLISCINDTNHKLT